jgi:hypothetical protein
MAGIRHLETIAALFVLLLVAPTAPGRETGRPSLGKAADRVLKQFEQHQLNPRRPSVPSEYPPHLHLTLAESKVVSKTSRYRRSPTNCRRTLEAFSDRFRAGISQKEACVCL